MIKAIVTGHSKGLGEGIAAALMAQGIAVLGVSRGPAPHLAARFPQLLSEARADLSDSAALAAWVDSPAMREFAVGCSMILLVNNAGTVQPVGSLADQPVEDVLRAVTLNVAAPLALAAAVVRVKGAASCKILHISSGAGRSAMAGWSVYCATKAALDRHAEAVALDGDASVRCVSLAPGVIDTAMQGEIRASTTAQFPNLERFIQMKEEGGLQSAEATGEKIVEFLLVEGFGSKPVADIRG